MTNRMSRRVRLGVLLLALSALSSHGNAQDIEVLPAGKMKPEQSTYDRIQITVRNLAPLPQVLRIRSPGGNWQSVTFQQGMGLTFRCLICKGAMDAQLPDDNEPMSIIPGTEYQITFDAARRRTVLSPTHR